MSLKSFCSHLKLPILLVTMIVVIALVGESLPLPLRGFFYAVSLSIKEVLLLLLPAIIFALIFNSTIKLKQGALKLIILLLFLICLSNTITTWIAYFIGKTLVNYTDFNLLANVNTVNLQPMWLFSLPEWIDNKYAMALAVGCGLTVNLFNITNGAKVAEKLAKVVDVFLHKFFLPIIPVFILGFILKLESDDLLINLIKNYAVVFGVIFIAQISYLSLLYAVANKFNFRLWFTSIKNMLPAGISGFSAMSSAVAMPLTLLGTEKNIKDQRITNFVIPSTVNFHLVGDCIAIPIFAIVILLSFGYSMPSLGEYAVFVVMFVIAKFGVAAIPGGGILVMFPILTSQLGFNSEMLSIIHAAYVMFDSVATGSNVMGNGAFAMIFSKVFTVVDRIKFSCKQH